jgi:PcfJ-like protein
MHTSFQVAPMRGAKRARLRARDIERQLRRFPAEARPYVVRAARIHPAMADLVIAFPALMIAIAMPKRGFDHQPVIARVIAGDPLDVLARQAGVPMWLRKLPPEAFAGPLRTMPAGEMFARRIGNHLPKRPRDAAEWLRIVGFANEAAHEPFGLWVAKSLAGHKSRKRWRDDKRLPLVALWAWHSQRPETLAGSFIQRRWTPAMTYGNALLSAHDWLSSIDIHVAFAGVEAMEPWLRPGTCNGMDFLPVLSASGLIAEAAAMRHCVGDYARSIVDGDLQIWSVQRDGRRLATIEVSARQGQLLLGVGQLWGRQNETVAKDVALAVRQWPNSHPPESLQRQSAAVDHTPHQRLAWQNLWTPYWLSRGRVPRWLPLLPPDYVSDLGWRD